MQHEDRVRLQHMLDACYEALSFSKGQEVYDLEGNRLLLLALIKCIEIIGEAATRTSAEFQDETPQIPWHAIIAMRNRLIHGYFDVNPRIIWKTVNEEIPVLIPLLEELLD